MPKDGLDRADWYAIRRLFEDPLDSHSLALIIRWSPGAMRANIADLVWLQAAMCQRFLHGACRAITLRVGCRNVVRVTGQPVASHLSIDAGAAGERLRQGVKHEHSRPLTRDHALTVAVKGAADIGCDGAEPRKTGIGDAGKGICPAGQH